MKKQLTVITALIFSFGYADVVINEVQSSNDATCVNELGESADWIELYNNGAEAVDLSGWGLSDNVAKPFKWAFAEGTTIKAGEYLRVFADSMKTTDVMGQLEPMLPNDAKIKDDLVVWFTGDKALEQYGEGGSVASWMDESGYGNNATNTVVANQPVVYSNRINGHAAVAFDELSKHELDFNHLDFHGMESMSNYTVIAVTKWSGRTPKSSGHGLFGLTNTSLYTNNVIFQVMKNPLGRVRLQSGTINHYCLGQTLVPDTWNSLGSSRDSDRETPRIAIYQNQNKSIISASAGAIGPMNSFARMMLGRGFIGDNRFYDGEIAEFLIFRKELRDDYYRAVSAYLEEKYDLRHANNPHTTYSLSGSGETLVLTPVGASEPTDQITFGSIPCDTSYGRTTDGWAYFADPTPGSENAETSYEAPLEPVQFSVTRGICVEPFELTLSHANPGATIYYTLDYSEPTSENGYRYEGPITISGTTIVRATAVCEGALPARNIATQTYLFMNDIFAQQKPEIAPTMWTDGASTWASYSLSESVIVDEETKAKFLESLQTVPIVSITMSDDDLFNPDNGLYTKARSLKGQEKVASVEWMTGAHVFGVDAGVRIQGNTSPSFAYTPKKSFRLCFRGRYGTGSLKEPVLDDVGCMTADFNTLILRAENGNSWPGTNGHPYGTNMRDQFIRDLQGEISGYQSKGTHVGVFLNGLYWGLYNLCERDDADSVAQKFGGEKRNYNVISAFGGSGANLRDGAVYPYKEWIDKLMSSDLSDRAVYENAIKDLDLEGFIDYMIIKQYVGDPDWPHNNWEVAHSPIEGVPYRFFIWDTEGGLKYPTSDHVGTAASPKLYGPQEVHIPLTASPEYRLRFADRVQKHCLTPGAPLSLDGLPARYAAMAAKVRPRVYAEAARWGAYRHDAGLQEKIYGLADWDSVCSTITNSFVKARTTNYLKLLRNYNLYPSVDAPALSCAEEGASATIGEVSGGKVYYTIDGSDPRVAFEGLPSASAAEYAGEEITSEEDCVVKARVLSDGGEWSALVEQPIVGSAPAVVRNEFLMSTNGENWDKDANWSEGYFPNEAGATAVIGVPTEFKKDKGWRNIHINKTNVTVGHLEVTSGGCTNRIDTGKSGNLTFSGKLDAEGVATEAASIVVMDEANPSLLMIDLDAPNKVVLATDLDVVVSNAVGDVEFGGALFKGAWEGNGHNLAKSGVGRLTLDVANTAETAFGKIQVAEGSVDITKKIYAEAITKEGVCSAKLGGSELESAVAAASELSDKVSVNNVRLFIPSYLGGATYYGAFVATSLTTANAKKGKTVSAYIRDLSGDVRFDGKTYRQLTDATIGTQTLEDGRVTYKVSVPQQDVRAEISSMAQGEGLAIGMETLPGQKYTLQYRESLSSGEWANVMTLEGDGQFHEFTVEMSGSSGFYRVVVGD